MIFKLFTYNLLLFTDFYGYVTQLGEQEIEKDI